MRARYPFAGLLLLLCGSSAFTAQSTDETASALLPLEARSADLSGEDDVISTSYVLPNQIFNDGKPYYARQDPVSGQLDFSDKKPAGIEPEFNEVLNSKEKIVLNGGSSPNIHDFLNLPVKYSSSKFVYPLVSSSYANLKYQGSNKNYVTNKKPTSVVAPVTVVPPRYSHSENYFPVTTTKLTAVTPTEPGYFTTSTRASTPSPTTRGTPRTTPSTTASTTPSTTTVRYTTTTRRTAPTVAATTPVPPRLITTRKKFVPFKKTSPSTTSASLPPSTTTPAKLPKPTLSSNEKFTTHHPTPQAAIFPTDPTTTTKVYTSSTASPVVFTTTTPRPVPVITDATKLPNLDPADVYHTLGQKNNKVQQELELQQQKQQQQQQQILQQQQQQYQQQQQQHQQEYAPQPTPKPAMTLSDIFNSLAEEEVAVANNYQQNQGFDAQGNLIEPIAPSQPSPFAMQPQYPHPTAGQGQPPSQTVSKEQQLISGSLESYGNGNEYVSYQVQQPNMMQYRPMPGQINNVVISPGQQSASFVLGSQQQVGHSGSFGNVEKEPLFSKDSSGVQYGQVINEDIANINRPQPPHSQHQQQFPHAPPAPQPTPPSSQQQMPSIQSSSKFQQSTDATVVGVGAGGNYPQPPPEAPTPYQQLPLIASNLRPAKKQPPKVVDTISAPNNQLLQSAVPAPKPAAAAAAAAQDTKELLVSTNIRFPANDEESIEQSSAGVLPGPPAGPSINGHAQPLSLQQIQHANPVVFPKINDEEVGSSNVQIQQHEVLNINQHKQQLTFPAQSQTQTQNLPEQMPSQDMMPPPRFVPQPQAGPGKRPPFYKEFDRKQQAGPQPGGPPSGPRPNINLPNILPQFRPNAKISNGHNPSLKQELGNVRLPYNPSTPPQFAHRRQPLQQQQQLQKRYPMNRISEYGPANPALDVNRRIYRLPPNGAQRMVPHMRERLYARRPNLPNMPNLPNVANGPPRGVDGYPAERHAPHAEPYKLNPGDLDDLEEDDLVINDPPQAPNNERQTPSETKLEAVVTLQMLQSQKKPVNGDDTGAGEIQVTADNDPQEALATRINEPSSIYGDYPKEEATLSEGKDPTSPAVEYQNTPFSVIRDQPQEPILKNKKPQSLQQQTKGQQLPKQRFPYPIEKPDPSYTELHQPGQPGQVAGVLIAPRIINSAFSSGTEAPIAIAYTPTEPSTFRRNGPLKQEQNPGSLHAETQTEQVLSNDFDLRGHNYEKDFMAPFYPSASLGGAPSNNPTPSNWKIVSSAPDPAIYEKNSINRADVEPSAEDKKPELEASNSTDFTTEKNFELDSFQPQLQGGFKPIYPPDYKLMEQKEEETAEQSEEQKKPMALALTGVQSPPAKIISTGVITSSSSSSTSTSTQTQTQTATASSRAPTTTTTNLPETTKVATPSEIETISTSKAPASQPKPSTPTKKSTFETSLAALLFGEDDEYEDGARKTESAKPAIERAPAGPRNVARMGPRSMRS